MISCSSYLNMVKLVIVFCVSLNFIDVMCYGFSSKRLGILNCVTV